MEEKILYKYEVEPTPIVLFLMYLSHVYRLDLETLLLLYDRIGENVLFVFYMFSGKSFIMPKHSKMFKINKFSEIACRSLETGESVECRTKQDSSFISFLDSIYDKKSERIVVEFEMPIHKMEEEIAEIPESEEDDDDIPVVIFDNSDDDEDDFADPLQQDLFVSSESVPCRQT